MPRGGRREGAGRKIAGDVGKTTRLSFRLAPEYKAAIKNKAAEENKSISDFVVDRCLNDQNGISSS